MRSCILFCVAAFLALSWFPSSVFIVSSVLAPSSPSSHHPASLYRSLISFAISFVQWLLLLPVASLAVLLDVLVTVEESLLVTKNPTDEVFSRSTVKKDEIEAVVMATGLHTSFGVEKEYVILLAARASRTENQDAIDAAIVRMLADPKEA
ncbi:hypothetical protein S245_020170 [Arachis hypogaea]